MSATEARYQDSQKPGEGEQFGALLGSGGFLAIPSRLGATQQGLVASQALNLSYFRAPRAFHSTSVKMYTGSTAAAATPTLIRHGLWLVDPLTGNLTSLVASTPNDTTLFAATNTGYSKNWSSTFDFSRGQWYAHGILIVSAVALPTVFGIFGVNGFILSGVLPRVSGTLLTQADLPATATGASLSGATGTGRVYVEFN